MPRYAATTTVSSNKSRDEIERTLTRYGADQFMYGWQDGSAVIAFRANERRVRFMLPLPDRNAKEFTHHDRGRASSRRRSALRASDPPTLAGARLVIKAKLEAVEAGISEFEDEFLAHVMLPTGQTVGEWMRPQVAEVYLTGRMPPLLPMLTHQPEEVQ
jgi:hypothetical protein